MKNDEVLLNSERMKLTVYGFMVIILLQVFYLIKFIVQSASTLGFFVLSTSVLTQSFVIWWFRKSDNRKSMILIWMACTYVSAAYLIGVSGGLKAPGFFWLFGFPIVLGIFAGGRYAVVSIIPVIFTFLIYYINIDILEVPISFRPPEKFYREVLQNSILFSIILSILLYLNHRALQNSKNALEKKTKQLDTLIRVMCHDLKNDIFVGEFHIDKMIEKGEYDARRAQKLRRAIENVKIMMIKVSDWSLFKEEENNLAPVIDLSPILEDSLKGFEVQLEEKSIELIQVLDIKGVKVKFDPVNLKFQVLNNIFSNAIKFTPDGGSIQVKAFIKGNEVIIQIEDSGIGIGEDKIKELFDIKKRGSTDGTRGEKGTGFGLPLMKEFLDEQSASIEIFSPPRGSQEDSNFPGTEFELRFKRA